MDQIGNTISNFIAKQFPQHYREYGPMLVAFVENYFEWLESKSIARNEYFNNKFTHVKAVIESANVIGTGSLFQTHFANGDMIAICKSDQTDDFDFYTIANVANNTFLTLKPSKLPDFSLEKAKYATVAEKPNAVFLTRNFFDIKDIDKTFDEYVVFFKEKYLKFLQFETITNTKTLVKHSLDLYRSKGTERSVDLLYKIVFGKPATVLPVLARDLFRLSMGDWFIPNYLELSLSPANPQLISKQVVGTISGATAFVEEIIRRVIGTKVVELAYISAIHGNFITGEKVSLPDNSLRMQDAPVIVGSLNQIQVNVNGVGTGFAQNEIVNITSIDGHDGRAKVLTTANTTGQVFFELEDGGYGYANTIQLSNTTGNVAVASGVLVTGTGTLFQTQYTNGDYISVWSNASFYHTRTVSSIASNTLLTVDSAFSFTNAQTKAAYTRYSAQTFVSEKVLHLSEVVIDTAYTNYEYFYFLDNITEPLALINYESANGTFVVGDMIYTYSPVGTAKVLVVSRATTTSGTLTVAPYSGNFQASAIYTTANAIGASIPVANGYTDVSATANVIGTYANVIVTCNNISGEFNVGEHLVQLSSGAHGIITAAFTEGSNITFNVANTTGIYKSGIAVEEEELVIVPETGATAKVLSVDIYVGVINVNNAFLTLEGNWANTPYLHGYVETVSRGVGADVMFSNNILYPETINYNTDYVYPYTSLALSTTWPFPAFPTSNLATTIFTSLSYANLVVGKVSAIISSTPGTDYNFVPVIRFHEPTTYAYGYPETLLMQVNDTTNFDIGELITQTSTNARGLVKIIEQPFLYVQNLRFWPNGTFITTSSVPTQIVGTDSGTVANVVSVAPVEDAPRFGRDTAILNDLVVGSGAITSLQVLDSGFGFVNGEIVTITSLSGNNVADGYAVDTTYGTGAGYYKDRESFISDVKMLSDGFYWQEYSYDIRSGVVSDFKSILKNVVHVAGTGYFNTLLYDSINNTEPSLQTIHTQTQA